MTKEIWKVERCDSCSKPQIVTEDGREILIAHPIQCEISWADAEIIVAAVNNSRLAPEIL